MYYYKRIRELREDNDLKQKEVAGILNITREQYQLNESGKREIKTNQLILLADYYRVSTDYILGRTDNPEMNINKTRNKNQVNIGRDNNGSITMK